MPYWEGTLQQRSRCSGMTQYDSRRHRPQTRGQPFGLSHKESIEQHIPENYPAETMHTTLQTSTSLLLLPSMCSTRHPSLLLPGLDGRQVEVALLETMSSTRPRHREREGQQKRKTSRHGPPRRRRRSVNTEPT